MYQNKEDIQLFLTIPQLLFRSKYAEVIGVYVGKRQVNSVTFILESCLLLILFRQQDGRMKCSSQYDMHISWFGKKTSNNY